MKQTTQTTIDKDGKLQQNITEYEADKKYVYKSEVDDSLSPTSENPVQNKVVTAAISTKAEITGSYSGMTAGKANQLTTARTIDGMSFNGTSSIVHYGTCSTAGITALKVTLPGFVLVTGARITVNFTESIYADTASSPTLNVDNTGAKPIKNGNATTGIKGLKGLIDFIYDGTNWCIINGYQLADKPIGSHWIQYEGEETPAARFGGTWTVDTDYTGRVLLGSGIGYALGATGGSADAVVVKHGGHIRPGDASFDDYEFEVAPSNNSYYMPISLLDQYSDNRTFRVEMGNEVGFRTQYRGEDGTGKNIPPYKVVAVWKRTA